MTSDGFKKLYFQVVWVYITKHKADYYRLLQSVRTDNTWEEWILFMLNGIEQTANQTIQLIHQINELMQQAANDIQTFSTKLYSKDLLETLFVHPYTKIEFIEKRLNITRQTASKHLKQLESLGILHSTKLGNSKYFINHRFYDLLSHS